MVSLSGLTSFHSRCACLQPSGSKFTSVNTISFAEDMNSRYRSTMEDACVVIDGFADDNNTGLFAIYDGHGGRNVAEFLRLHLHGNIEKELRAKGDRSVEECLKTAFLVTDMECSGTGEQASGSTAALCVVRRMNGKRYVYSANCGDARAVLCHDGRAVRLTKVRTAGSPTIGLLPARLPTCTAGPQGHRRGREGAHRGGGRLRVAQARDGRAGGCALIWRLRAQAIRHR